MLKKIILLRINYYFWENFKSKIMNIPDNLKFTKDHEWIRVEGEEAYIGVTDFAQGELGDIVYVEIEDRKSVVQGKSVDLGGRRIIKKKKIK